MTAAELLDQILPAWLATLSPRRRDRVSRLMRRPRARRRMLQIVGDFLDLRRWTSDLTFLQGQLLHARAFGRRSPWATKMRSHYRRLTGRAPEDGRLHAKGPFLARWPTGHDTVYLEGPFKPGAHGVLLSRFGFSSRGNIFQQRANDDGRAWTKAVRVVDRLAAGQLVPDPPRGRGTGRMRLPRFDSVRAWLAELDRVRERGLDEPVSRYVVALARAEPAKLLAAAEWDDIGHLANALRAVAPRLDEAGRAARDALVARIAYARTQRSEIVKGFGGGIWEPAHEAGWIFGRQGPYVVAQPPNLAEARRHEGGLRRAGFKRRGGGFAVLVGPRRDDQGRPVSSPAAEAALALARETIVPSDRDLGELGRRWARAEIERLEHDPRALGRHGLTPAGSVQALAAKRLGGARGSERSFWQGVAEASQHLPRAA